MKIAIMGIRGIPANYGGFETFAEELATRLVTRGHEVTVYGRSNNIKYSGKYYKGVELVILPTISHKYLDTVAIPTMIIMAKTSKLTAFPILRFTCLMMVKNVFNMLRIFRTAHRCGPFSVSLFGAIMHSNSSCR